MVAKLISLIFNQCTTRPDRGQIGIQKPHFTKISSLFFVQHVHVQQLPFSSITISNCWSLFGHSIFEWIENFLLFFALQNEKTAKCLKVNIQNRDRKIIVKCLRVNCCAECGCNFKNKNGNNGNQLPHLLFLNSSLSYYICNYKNPSSKSLFRTMSIR